LVYRRACDPSIFGRVTRRSEGVLPGGATPRIPESSEAELVKGARQGDPRAFEALVRVHAERLYAVLLRFTADAEEAEEAFQDALMRAWRSIGKFEERSSFFTWLYRIGINEAKRRAERRSRRGQMVSTEDESLDEIRDLRPAPDTRAAQQELRGALEVAITELPLEYQIPLVLRDIEGLSTSDAAAVMELSEPAFKSRLHRARMRVRNDLEPLLDE
jgi:RNA polymerase sigma-70 factor, ECF subfamily